MVQKPVGQAVPDAIGGRCQAEPDLQVGTRRRTVNHALFFSMIRASRETTHLTRGRLPRVQGLFPGVPFQKPALLGTMPQRMRQRLPRVVTRLHPVLELRYGTAAN